MTFTFGPQALQPTAAKFNQWLNKLLQQQQRTAPQGAQPRTTQVTTSQEARQATTSQGTPQATTFQATPRATTSQVTPQATSQTRPQPQSITERTALRYMERLGFRYKTFRQGIQYTDGHKREDIVKYRKTYRMAGNFGGEFILADRRF